MSKEKKANVKKIILCVLLGILGVIVLAVAVMAILNVSANKSNLALVNSFNSVSYERQLVPEKDKDGIWTFATDEDFKIMQLTDVHVGGGCLSKTKDQKALNAVAAMITAEKPDLVVITGDLAFPVPFMAGTFNNLIPARQIATMMENLGVYWVPIFGNHDTEMYSFYNRKEISEFYGSGEFKHCLFEDLGENVDGYGNNIINVKNSDGIITQTLYLFDSHSYVSSDKFGIGGKYDSIHENQMTWYRENVKKYNDYNKALIETMDNKEELIEKYGTVKSLAFYHIPSAEYLEMWEEYSAAGYKDTENIKYYYGTIGEPGRLVCCGENPDSFFETMLECGSTKGIFCGHDHLNNFSVDYKGIRLTYGYSIDYLAYSGIDKLGTQRGCTIITVSPGGTFTCKGENYYQDKYPVLGNAVKEDVTMQELSTAPQK